MSNKITKHNKVVNTDPYVFPPSYELVSGEALEVYDRALKQVMNGAAIGGKTAAGTDEGIEGIPFELTFGDSFTVTKTSESSLTINGGGSSDPLHTSGYDLEHNPQDLPDTKAIVFGNNTNALVDPATKTITVSSSTIVGGSVDGATDPKMFNSRSGISFTKGTVAESAANMMDYTPPTTQYAVDGSTRIDIKELKAGANVTLTNESGVVTIGSVGGSGGDVSADSLVALTDASSEVKTEKVGEKVKYTFDSNSLVNDISINMEIEGSDVIIESVDAPATKDEKVVVTKKLKATIDSNKLSEKLFSNVPASDILSPSDGISFTKTGDKISIGATKNTVITHKVNEHGTSVEAKEVNIDTFDLKGGVTLESNNASNKAELTFGLTVSGSDAQHAAVSCEKISDLEFIGGAIASSIVDLPSGRRKVTLTLPDSITSKDGYSVELKVADWPEDPQMPASDKEKSILWRHMPKTPEEVQEWKLLIYEKDLKGTKGDPGAPGAVGQGLAIHGTVNHRNDLTLRATYTNLGITTPVIGTMMFVNGVNESWIYKGPVDHKPGAGEEGWQFITNWTNIGKLAGIKGDRGPRGYKGDKGDSGGIGAFLTQWIINAATSAAVSAATSAAVTEATQIANDIAMKLEDEMEDAAKTAVKETFDELKDELKGDKGEKGDKGDDGDKGEDGKDGKSCEIVGAYATKIEFQLAYPLTEENVGKAALIGNKEDGPRELWGIVKGILGLKYEDFGDIRGPKGEDADWTIRLRDKFNVQIGGDIQVAPVAQGVPNLFIQGKDGVEVEHYQGSSAGFAIKLEKQLPPVNGDVKDFYLSNDGTDILWKDIGDHNAPKDKLLLKSPAGHIFGITVDDLGRLSVELQDNVQ